MSTGRPKARALATSPDATQDEIARLERGLEALAFLERSRELADEPIGSPAGAAPAGTARAPLKRSSRRNPQ